MPGRLGRSTSVIGLGCWQLGADWGDVDDDVAQAILNAAADAGTTFFDTADVYGDGRSEKALGRFLASRDDAERLIVATKMGRRANPHVAEAYTLDNFRAWTDRSRENLGVDRLDLVQLHCPPTAVFSDPRTYDNLATLVSEGRVENVGVSVETVQEALLAIGEPAITSVQIIINVFRRKPLERVVAEARGRRRHGDRAGSSRERAPERSVRRVDGLRRERSPELQPDRRGVRHRRDLRRGPVRRRRCGRLARSPRSPPGDGRRPRWRFGGSSTRRSTRSFPGPAPVEQAVSNAAVGDLPSLTDADARGARRDLQPRHSRATSTGGGSRGTRRSGRLMGVLRL